MPLTIELSISLLGAIASVIGIYQFWIKSAKTQDLPSISAEIKFDDDHKVLSINKSDSKKEGTLSYFVYKYVNEYSPEGGGEPYFIYNPRGHYLASRSMFIQLSTGGVFFASLGLALLFVYLFVQSNVDRPVWILAVLGAAFFLTGTIQLYKSRKHFLQAGIAEDYVNFLRKNEITVGVAMLQSKSAFGKTLETPR